MSYASLTLLHSERPKLCGGLAILRALGFTAKKSLLCLYPIYVLYLIKKTLANSADPRPQNAQVVRGVYSTGIRKNVLLFYKIK